MPVWIRSEFIGCSYIECMLCVYHVSISIFLLHGLVNSGNASIRRCKFSNCFCFCWMESWCVLYTCGTFMSQPCSFCSDMCRHWKKRVQWYLCTFYTSCIRHLHTHNICTRARKCTHTYTHTHICICTHTCIHTHIHVYAYTHTCAHRDTHERTHVHDMHNWIII